MRFFVSLNDTKNSLTQNLKQMKKMRFSIQKLAIILLATVIAVSSCKKKDDVTKSPLKQVLTFQFATLTPIVNATINEANKTITADVPAGTNIAALIPTITISPLASINPATGVAQNFTNPVNYTVTAENGTSVVYTVTVTVGGLAPLDPLTLNGSMSSNQTLPNRNAGIDYIIDGVYNIDGNALLTIEPGVKIAFTGVDSKIVVNSNAGLRMVGTAAEPIILTGPVNNPNKGSWSGIDFYSNRSDNEMKYVQLINSGSSSTYGVIYISSGSALKFDNCTIDGALGNGLYVSGDGKVSSFTNNTIKNCDKSPIFSDYIAGVIAVSGPNTYTSNGENKIFINSSNEVAASATLHVQSIPYLFDGGLIVGNSSTFTIEAGNVIEMGPQTTIYINESAKLIASGTSSQPIVITGKNKDAGYWGYIEIRSAIANKMEYCTIEYGGHGNYSMLYIGDGATVTLNNNIFRNSSNHGANRYSSSNAGITASGNTFSSCPSGNVYNRSEDNTSTNF
jgi:hypothetical protein